MKIISLNAWGGQVWPALAAGLAAVAATSCACKVIRPSEPRALACLSRSYHRSPEPTVRPCGGISAALQITRLGFLRPWGHCRTQVANPQSQHGLGQWVAPHPGRSVRDKTGLCMARLRRRVGHGPCVPRGTGCSHHKVGRTSVTVAHFHELRDIGGKGDTPARADQTKCAPDVVVLPSPRNDVVLAGDFNGFAR
jgi:hypothetical protein